jgi:hypothetical protein
MSLTAREVNILTGKALVGAQNRGEQVAMASHITELEELLDEADMDDFFGTEGWRHRLGMED